MNTSRNNLQNITPDRRRSRPVPAPTFESDADLYDRLATEAALRAHQELAAALETDLLMMRLRGMGA